MKNKRKSLMTIKTEGIGIIEIILILVIIIGLIIIFREQITDLVQRAVDAISNDASEILGE